MPNKKSVIKPKKQKLSKEERSQIAKDRWVKRRKQQEPIQIGRVSEAHKIKEVMERVHDTPVPPPIEQETQVPNGRDEHGVPSVAGLGDGTITPNGDFVPDKPAETPPPAPQLAAVKPPKQKRAPVPKEFSVALKAAESRLAKAITDRAEAYGKYLFFNAEIPNLVDIIKALGGSHKLPAMISVPAPFDAGFQSPAYPSPIPQFQPQHDPLAAIQAAMAAPPVSRAVGNAVQFSPDVVGSLEGPEDDNPDRFIAGPNAGASGWIGG